MEDPGRAPYVCRQGAPDVCRQEERVSSLDVDWYFDGSHPGATTALRQEFRRFLDRHASEGSDVAGAELALEEMVANTVRHGGGHGWVRVDWPDDLIVTVYDLGESFTFEGASLPDDALAEGGRGLFIVSSIASSLEVEARRCGGTAVRVAIPISRAASPSLDPPRRRTLGLPTPEEADAEGAFPREAFLRALVVELADHVELEHGVGAAAGAIAQVGTDVGSRMEEGYRSAQEIVGRLSPEQIGDLYVRLKAAIDGDFYLIEANEKRIVLGNRRCPFGEVVKRAPSLCRMTSSVFGGIAARNAGSAAVQLQERIAIGDAECRVVVLLDPDEDEVGTDFHLYRA